ncbi:MAG: hypothetical protein M3Q94_17440 [Pseudomonadota bacterium]|nr:hypothetical protein [Pseudomonadota bacterium]
MNELESLPVQLFGCLMLGVALFAAMLLTVGMGKLWRHVWAWVDDSEPGRNPVLEFMARLRGWTPYDTKGISSTYLWWKGKKGEQQPDVLLMFFPITIFAPLAIYLSVKLYPVLLTALTLMVVAYVARFARRHRKLFDKHLKDPEAHK